MLRRVRGTIGNVAIWGVGWAVLGFATNMVMRLTGIVDAPASVIDAALVGLKVGLGGCIAAAVFSTFIAFSYRDRRIQDISSLKFGAGGAAMTVVSIAAFVNAASILGGGGLVPWRHSYPTLSMFAVFGFVAAASSMKLAQLATSPASGDDEVLLDEQRAQVAPGVADIPLQQRLPISRTE